MPQRNGIHNPYSLIDEVIFLGIKFPLLPSNSKQIKGLSPESEAGTRPVLSPSLIFGIFLCFIVKRWKRFHSL